VLVTIYFTNLFRVSVVKMFFTTYKGLDAANDGAMRMRCQLIVNSLSVFVNDGSGITAMFGIKSGSRLRRS
jgi:hypothetical protein